ncbi:type II toxin-antitoxin system VapC family toxin [Luteolibacter yonseiensis]|uniref:Type II toxin-antitoxin system VapC family toxin n=1 Tax=Luteolibacter yonseiensis TaxID=1144680 RepID=A0A934V9S3_9BACT|nr:type II toxin-antitoxin system VapC family toxin [Luteolibacter yonseiensis]MBK1815453.1 type II toxin-antitoxin system VapC family toxin [Luteolibacter yonseiensis]
MSANYLLDTCAWLDAFAAPELLKPSVRKLLSEESVLHVSAISLLEVSRKEAEGELIFGVALAKWFQLALPEGRVRVLQITPDVSIDATRLPAWEHKDPADQIIVATARVHGLKVVTSDSKILKYPHVASIASRKS